MPPGTPGVEAGVQRSYLSCRLWQFLLRVLGRKAGTKLGTVLTVALPEEEGRGGGRHLS